MIFAVEQAHQVPSLIWSVPFILMLLAIAVFPLFHGTHHWWEKNSSKLAVSLLLSIITLLYYQFRGFGLTQKDHATDPGWSAVVAVLHHAILSDYIPFIVLLFTLFTISGGVQWKLLFRPTPVFNSAILLLGSGLASLIGTTGASMLLIRPLIAANHSRKHKAHTVIFFIFLVSNIGGALTPLGDPPLFLGYLRGVPFVHTIQYWPEWLFCIGVLLVVYFCWDFILYSRDSRMEAETAQKGSRIQITGRVNYLWLGLVILAVLLLVPGRELLGTKWIIPHFLREAVLMGLSALSWLTTPKRVRQENEFNFGPILEVACLFIGIFICMQPPMELLHLHGKNLGIEKTWQFFWACGLLSSVLDNAPTYAVFFETAGALTPQGHVMLAGVETVTGQIPVTFLEAISLGAVLMGALTYIGNGPNFMVRSIAEAKGVKMPGFFGYMLYSFLILLPLFVVISFWFLRK